MFQLNIGGSEQADSSKIYDLVVVGAGAAGLTSAIYASRDGWETLVLEKEASGGLAATTHLIENYPGFPEGIDGSELMEKFAEQAKRFGAQIVEFEEVTGLKKNTDGIFEIATTGATYKGRTVILATGSSPKHLGIPGEEEFANKGVSYCATCDGPLFKGQDVVVIGCGNSGLQEAQILLEYAKSVTFVEFLSYSIAEKVLQDRVVHHPKVKCYFSHMAVEIKGDDFVNAIVIKDRETGALKEIPTQGVFVYVGYRPYTDFVKGVVELDERGYILTDAHMHTNIPGVFAAGDVRSGNLAQVAVAVGDGAKAAIAVREYLQAQEK